MTKHTSPYREVGIRASAAPLKRREKRSLVYMTAQERAHTALPAGYRYNAYGVLVKLRAQGDNASPRPPRGS